MSRFSNMLERYEPVRKQNEIFKKGLPIVHRRNRSLCRGVYFVKWRDYIKIGCSIDIRARVKSLRVSIPEGDMEPLGWIVYQTGDLEQHEAKVHDAMAAFRVRGEWFRDCPELRRFIERYAMAWPS